MLQWVGGEVDSQIEMMRAGLYLLRRVSGGLSLLRRRGPAVVFLAAAVPFGSLPALQHVICTGDIVNHVPQGRFISSATCQTNYITYRVAWLKRHPPRGPVVYVAGGSSTLDTVTSPASFAADIAARGSAAPSVNVLGCSEQRPAEQLAIVDNLPRAKGVLLVLGVSERSFFGGPGAARDELHGLPLIMKSPTLRSLVIHHTWVDPGNDLGPGIRAFLRSYKASRGVPAFHGPKLRFLLHGHPKPPLSLRVKHNLMGIYMQKHFRPWGDFETNFDFGASTLSRVVRLAEAKGYRVLLMETPLDSAVTGDGLEPYLGRCRAVFDRIVARYGAAYCNLNPTAGLTNDDFYDCFHLIAAGREKWQPLLADVVAAMYAGTYVSPSPTAPPVPPALSVR